MTVRLRLRELLDARGLTLRDLDSVPYAVLLELQAGTLAKPRAEHIFLIATRLGVQPSELTADDDRSPEADAIRKLRVRYHQ